MSLTVDFTTVTNSIAALSISGVTIRDVDEIPDAIGLDTHILQPVPDGFLSNIEITRDELTAQKLVLRYTLAYRFYLCRVSTAGLLANYSSLMSYAAAVLLAFSNDATLSGALDADAPQITNIGTIQDPAGNVYLAFDIILRIHQFLEV